MKIKHLLLAVSVILVISLIFNIKVVIDSQNQKKESEADLLMEINRVTRDAEELLRYFISNDKREEDTLIAATQKLDTLHHLISSNRNIVYLTMQFNFVVSFILDGGDMNGRRMSAIYVDGEIADNGLAFLQYLADGLKDIGYTSMTINKYNERLNKFNEYFYHTAPNPFDLLEIK